MTFMLETITPLGRKYLKQWVWNEWILHKLPVKKNPSSSECFLELLSLETNDGQFINEGVECPESLCIDIMACSFIYFHENSA